MRSFIGTKRTIRRLTAGAIALGLSLSLAACGSDKPKDTTTEKNGTVTINVVQWQATVEVQELKATTYTAWSNPTGTKSRVKIKSKTRKVRSYRKVHDGWRTEKYTAQETRYRTESYTDYETRTKSESYTGTCSKTTTVNGKSKTTSTSCTKTRDKSYKVPVKKTRKVPYTVPVQKTRRVEITHQEPVYGTYYTYQASEYVHDDEETVSASGVSPAPVTCPIPDDVDPDERALPCRTTYSVTYTDQVGRQHSQALSQAQSLKYQSGQKVKARYTARNGKLVELISVNW